VLGLQVLQVQQSGRPDSWESTGRKYGFGPFLSQLLKLLACELFSIHLIGNVGNILMEVIFFHLPDLP
jgi:hypothetical protein